MESAVEVYGAQIEAWREAVYACLRTEAGMGKTTAGRTTNG